MSLGLVPADSRRVGKLVYRSCCDAWHCAHPTKTAGLHHIVRHCRDASKQKRPTTANSFNQKKKRILQPASQVFEQVEAFCSISFVAQNQLESVGEGI